MITWFKRFKTDERGSTAIEYGLLAAFVSITIIGALTSIGTSVAKMITNITAVFTTG